MDTESFWKLLKPVHPMAASFSIKLAGDRDEGEDLYQDALLAAMGRFHTLKDTAAFRPWLFRIIVNRYKNRCRSRWWRRHADLTPEIIESVAGDNPGDRYNLRRRLKVLLSRLPAEDRAIVVLHDIEGWSTRELAAMCTKPEGTIKTRLYRARARMRKILAQHSRTYKKNSSSLEVAYAMQRCNTVDESS